MGEISCGLMPGCRVCDVLPAVLDRLPAVRSAALRSIDSSTAGTDIARILDFHHIQYAVLGGNVCLAKEALREACSRQVFTGFDEVWFLTQDCPARDLRTLPPATSDAADFSDRVPAELLDAMRETGCVLVLADGCGLNYLTPVKDLADTIAGIV